MVTDYSERKQLIEDKKNNPSKYKGILTGFRRFDNFTGGLFKAEMTLIAAITGVGKSTFMKMMEYQIINLPANGVKNILHITNEENFLQVQTKFDAVYSGIPYMDFKKANITPEQLAHWEKIMQLAADKSRGQIFVKEIPQFTSVAGIEKTFVELDHRGVNIDAIFVDYCDLMSPVARSFDPNDEQAKIAADLKGLGIALDVPIVTATQAATKVEEKTEAGKPFGKLDVYGSKRKIHSAYMTTNKMYTGRLEWLKIETVVIFTSNLSNW
jgi:replicative DNA helicase